jgi:hypothetical protein
MSRNTIIVSRPSLFPFLLINNLYIYAISVIDDRLHGETDIKGSFKTYLNEGFNLSDKILTLIVS